MSGSASSSCPLSMFKSRGLFQVRGSQWLVLLVHSVVVSWT